jgi:hypothetical protein
MGQYPGQYATNQTGQYPPGPASQFPLGDQIPSGAYPRDTVLNYSQQPPAYSAGGFTLNEKSPE